MYLIYDNDDLAREILINKYKPFILSKISKINLLPDEREEFYAEGLICLIKAINSYNDKFFLSFNSYFALILKRKFIDLLRKKNKKERIIYMDNIEEFIVDASNNVENKILNEVELLLHFK